MRRILNRLEILCRRGLYFPMAVDPNTNKPSITLLIFYVMFIFMMGSIIYAHVYESFIPSLVTLACFISSFVFYKMRRVTDLKVDLDDKSLEIKDE